MAYLLPDMSADEVALFEGIRLDPDDDAPRLVYADWLDEHAQADQAELIRVQCELARGPADDRRRHLEDRQRLLLPSAVMAVADRAGPAGAMVWFARGLPERVWVGPSASLGQELSDLLRGLPVVDLSLEFVDDLAGVGALLGPAGRARLRALRWRSGYWYDRLREGLPREGADPDAGFAYLVRRRAFPRLRALEIRRYEFTARRAGRLARAPFFARLETLTLAETFLRPRGLRALTAGGLPAGLRELGLPGHQLGDAGVATLFGGAGPRGLRALDLDMCCVGPDGAAFLAGAPALAGLESLSLRWNPGVGPEGARHLARSPVLRHLKRLDLAGSRAGPVVRTLRKTIPVVTVR